MGTQLQYDILVSIAEKLVFSPDNEFRLDLRELKTLYFMVMLFYYSLRLSFLLSFIQVFISFYYS